MGIGTAAALGGLTYGMEHAQDRQYLDKYRQAQLGEMDLNMQAAAEKLQKDRQYNSTKQALGAFVTSGGTDTAAVEGILKTVAPNGNVQVKRNKDGSYDVSSDGQTHHFQNMDALGQRLMFILNPAVYMKLQAARAQREQHIHDQLQIHAGEKAIDQKYAGTKPPKNRTVRTGTQIQDQEWDPQKINPKTGRKGSWVTVSSAPRWEGRSGKNQTPDQRLTQALKEYDALYGATETPPPRAQWLKRTHPDLYQKFGRVVQGADEGDYGSATAKPAGHPGLLERGLNWAEKEFGFKPENQSNGQYQVGQLVTKGGRQWKIVSFDANGNPMVVPASPAAAKAAQLKEGVNTTLANGQIWTLQNGNPVRVK